MPIEIIGSMILDGPDVLPGWNYIKTYGPVIATVGALKYYFRGSTNTWERDLHGKVFMITGGTSGLGSSVVEELASKGAQIILLVRSLQDFWTVDYIQDLRERHSNFLIYAEECDLSSLYSIRKFATKWLDNASPRRLDGIICTAAESFPAFKERENSIDGIELQTAVNYVGHYHLLTLLSPSLRAQIPDRDVRVILTTCLSQALGEIDVEDPLFETKRYPKNKPWKVFGSSKLQLGLFAKEFQRRLLEIPRKDGSPCNIRVNVVNPGVMRSPSTKRVLSFGSIWGLILYIIFLPILWVFLKSSNNGAQSIYHTLMSPEFIDINGGNFISNCRVYKPARQEFEDLELQKKLYDNTEAAIAKVEKQSALFRKREEAKKPKAEKGKGTEQKGKVEEVTEEAKSNISTHTQKEELFPNFDQLKGKLNSDGAQVKQATKTKPKGKKRKA